MKVNVKMEVPALIVPGIKALRKMTGLSQHQIAQRVFDGLLPKVMAGTDPEKLLSLDTFVELFPEFMESVGRALGEVGIKPDFEGKSADEIMQGLAGLAMVSMVLDGRPN